MSPLDYKVDAEVMWGFFRRCRKLECLLSNNALDLDTDFEIVEAFILNKSRIVGTKAYLRTLSWMYAYRNFNGPQVWEFGEASVNWQNLFVTTLNNEGIYGLLTMDEIGFPRN